MDWDRNGEPELVGEFTTSAASLDEVYVRAMGEKQERAGCMCAVNYKMKEEKKSVSVSGLGQKWSA